MWSNSPEIFLVFSMNIIGLCLILLSLWFLRKKEEPMGSSKINEIEKELMLRTQEAEEILEELNDFSIYMMRQMENKHKELILLYQLIDEKQRVMNQMPDTEKKIVPALEGDPYLNKDQEQILTLYKEGKTIDEIAKRMHMGKGEVQLIIGLFQMR
ncbi:MAG: hypothetical protein GX962_16240 [Epulopiscium sp.]|nr:hypothetical protein [Candidatus Epulonipiscium sp.]